MEQAPEPWYSKKEVAKLRSVSKKTIQRKCKPHERVGGRNRYLLSQVDQQLPDSSPDLPAPGDRSNVVELKPRGAA